jgi:hypothetical protein
VLDRPAIPVPDGPMATFVRLGRRGELTAPLPGRGQTARRWAVLAGWGRSDPALGRLAEGHVDALAILAEAGAQPVPDTLYGVWAARSGDTGAELVETPGGAVLRGTVRFCSGAHVLDRALVVALGPDGPWTLDVRLDRPGVRRVPDTWRAAGMWASDSVDVELRDVPAPTRVGPAGSYLGRTGFWWGGAGVAAVWLGAAVGVLDQVHAALREGDPDPHQRALLGGLHTRMAAADALLVRTAALIDARPGERHRTAAWTVRAAVEQCCRGVLEVVPRLVGVATLTRRDGLEQRLADLGVYVRQHHGERDLAALGTAVLDGAE